MSKLIYPANGLYPRCKRSVERCATDIQSAISNCTFDIPSDFPYRGYLDGLRDTLNNYYHKINNIGLKIEITDKSFSNLSNRLTTSAGKITTSKIPKRDRMIV